MFRRSARSARSFDLLASDLSDRRSEGGCQTHVDGVPSIGNNAQAGGVSISSPDVTPLAPSVRASLVSSSASSPAGSYGLYGFPGLSPRVEPVGVVARIDLDDVRFAVETLARMFRSEKFGGAKVTPCSRWVLESASSTKSMWVAWSVPAQVRS